MTATATALPQSEQKRERKEMTEAEICLIVGTLIGIITILTTAGMLAHELIWGWRDSDR